MYVARLARPPSLFFTQPQGSSSPCRLHECTKRSVGGSTSTSLTFGIWIVRIGRVVGTVFAVGRVVGVGGFAGCTLLVANAAVFGFVAGLLGIGAVGILGLAAGAVATGTEGAFVGVVGGVPVARFAVVAGFCGGAADVPAFALGSAVGRSSAVLFASSLAFVAVVAALAGGGSLAGVPSFDSVDSVFLLGGALVAFSDVVHEVTSSASTPMVRNRFMGREVTGPWPGRESDLVSFQESFQLSGSWGRMSLVCSGSSHWRSAVLAATVAPAKIATKSA